MYNTDAKIRNVCHIILSTLVNKYSIVSTFSSIQYNLSAQASPWSLEAQNEMLVSVQLAHWKFQYVFEDAEGLDHVLVMENLILSVSIVNEHQHTSFSILIII